MSSLPSSSTFGRSLLICCDTLPPSIQSRRRGRRPLSISWFLPATTAVVLPAADPEATTTKNNPLLHHRMRMAAQQQHRHPKRRRLALALSPPPPLDSLADELLFLVLDRVAVSDPRALKSFALASRACHAAESRHRRVVRLLRADLLPAALARYPCATRLDLSLCARVPDAALASAAAVVAGPSSSSALRAVDLSRSRGVGAAGVAALTASCPGLADLDLSNGVDHGDAAAAEVARAKALRRLSLARWKSLTDMGLGCVTVGCAELRELSLKWCLGVSDFGSSSSHSSAGSSPARQLKTAAVCHSK